MLIDILSMPYLKAQCCQNKKTINEVEKFADSLAVIAEVNRLKILCLLRSGRRCVCEIWQVLGLPQNLASHHLGVLKKAGLVTDYKDGLKVFYSLDKKNMQKLHVAFDKFLKLHVSK